MENKKEMLSIINRENMYEVFMPLEILIGIQFQSPTINGYGFYDINLIGSENYIVLYHGRNKELYENLRNKILDYFSKKYEITKIE